MGALYCTSCCYTFGQQLVKGGLYNL